MKRLILALPLLLVACDDGEEASDPDATVDAGPVGPQSCGPAPAWNAFVEGINRATRVIALADGGFVVLGETGEQGRVTSAVSRYAADGSVVWQRSYFSNDVEAELELFQTAERDATLETMFVSQQGELVLAGSRRRFGEQKVGWILTVDLEDGRPEHLAEAEVEAWEAWPHMGGVIVAGLNRAEEIAVETLDEDGEPIDGPRFKLPRPDREQLVDVAVIGGLVVVLTTSAHPDNFDVQVARVRAVDAAGTVAWEAWIGNADCGGGGTAIEPHPQGGVMVVARHGPSGAAILVHYDAAGTLRSTRRIEDPEFGERHGFVAAGTGFLVTGAAAVEGKVFRWVGLLDERGLPLFGEHFPLRDQSPGVSVAATTELRLVMVGANSIRRVDVLVTEPFVGCPAPADDGDWTWSCQ